MMVVIVIIGMLATAVAVGVRRYLDSGRTTTAKMEIRKIQDAIDSFEAAKGSYPGTLNELIEPTDGGAAFLNGNLRDPWGHPYDLILHPNRPNQPYEVVSYGADNVEGGAGVNSDISSWDLLDAEE
jgi:general secretion pathway protein G